MTGELLRALWILGAPAVLGVLVLRACGLRFRADRLGFVAWTWPAGCLLLGAVLFTYLVCSVETALWWTAPLFALLAIGLLAARRSLRTADPGPVEPPIGTAFTAVVVLLSAWCVLHIVAGAARPLVEGDEGNIWSLKAKSLVVDWYRGEFAGAQQWNLHPDYPLLNPLLQAWVHTQAGHIEHFAARWLVQGCALSLLLATAAALRARLSQLHASLLLLLLPFARPFVQASLTCYADAMVALGVLLAVDGLLRFAQDGRARHAWLFGIGAAFAVWSKNEALLYLVAGAGAVLLWLVVRRPTIRGVLVRVAPPLLLPLAVVVAQSLFNRHFGLRNDLLGANPEGRSLLQVIAAQFGERAPAIGERAAQVTFLSFEPQALFFVAVIAPLLWRRRALGGALLPLWAWLCASLLGLHIVWLGSFLEVRFHLDTSYLRVLFQLLPAAMLWFAVLARGVLTQSDAPNNDHARPAA